MAPSPRALAPAAGGSSPPGRSPPQGAHSGGAAQGAHARGAAPSMGTTTAFSTLGFSPEQRANSSKIFASIAIDRSPPHRKMMVGVVRVREACHAFCRKHAGLAAPAGRGQHAVM
ncbi:unnamed protein product [Prorocentrum cordatum]|uniref:Uncharacterized protein n=1 Tax=Prorocentrum cordatum TaxID=2364126 RepID=A0ABN9VGN7_9DINO|nr:unnamed protein product [Polarella glacialis]